MIDGAAGRTNELDRGRPCQQAMTCAPDLSHPALSEPLEKTVAAQLSGLSDLVAEREEHARADVRHRDDQQVRKDKDEEELPGVRQHGGGYTANETAAITGTLLDAASAASTDRRGDEGTTMVKRSVQTATHESPIHVALRKVEALRLEQLRGGDTVAADNFKDDSDRGSVPRRQAVVANDSRDEERDGDRDGARQPMHDGAEHDGATGLRDERREEAGQKKDDGVQERHHAKALHGLPNQIAWQPLRVRA